MAQAFTASTFATFSGPVRTAPSDFKGKDAITSPALVRIAAFSMSRCELNDIGDGEEAIERKSSVEIHPAALVSP
ncbi:hypothetical protein [Variovorax ginsengisoli]|uniref:Uncharacterized protein n=1 Tax=Variovorax ginsengisoli TaxID=363844 RepID=A0ABT8SFB9_9BURK|nr:hypothetical protein [Variovorax ginsengisoli]MDN8618455.1 hypothetical protein [Variovorax ginsengisoli]MDO1537625.1 hypothetical protein [Variovorax ginsengisoli]